jgi:hypothetical protein
MPGYSGTPLPKKLGIRPGFRVRVVNEPMDVRAELQSALAGCEIAANWQDGLDFVLVFADSRDTLWSAARHAAASLAPDGMFWACWPKRASGVLTDLDEHGVRGIGLRTGLVDVKVCAVSETWSGLKFVRRVEDRPPRPTRAPSG